MARSAKQAEPAVEQGGGGPLQEFLGRAGGAIARNPGLVGASTAFAVTLSFVSANALWYQPHAHLGALFPTRDYGSAMVPQPNVEEPATTIRIERPEGALVPEADPKVEHVQKVLMLLDLYRGKADGIAGPNTRRAIADYQKLMGLNVDGEVDEELLVLLTAEERAIAASAASTKTQPDSGPKTGSIVPQPAPRQAKSSEPAKQGGLDPRIVKIQAGLRAFGNKDLEMDGVVGARTRAAIKEFQALFGLPETGEPDEAVYAKMRSEGLTN
ncbi:MAG: peptidoglycan-binding protein [Rhizobiaceae bacterium]|nr:peptidoglycan-binding protein [Rhizobiaceae bacterium]